MMKRLIYISILMALAAGVAACRQDVMLDAGDDVEHVGDIPIQIVATIADAQIVGDETATRAVERAKKTFDARDEENGVAGDIIHVQSTFKLKDDRIINRYCALRLNAYGVWEPLGNGRFYWPNDAVEGTFTAYYIDGSTGALTDDPDDDEEVENPGQNDDNNDEPDIDEPQKPQASTAEQLFSNIIDGQDPLRSVSVERYGHTVRLNFEHILTRLTIIELPAGVDDELIFSTKNADFIKNNLNNAERHDNNILEDDRAERQDTFKNGFRIEVVTDPNDASEQQIRFVYISRYEQTEGGPAARIKAQTTLVRNPVTRKETSEVGFFLEPNCIYDAFDIDFSNGDNYISYTNSLPEKDRGQVLKGNNRYTFNVTKSGGVTMNVPPEQKWDESDECKMIVDAEGFLRAVNTNTEYVQIEEDENGNPVEVRILEPTTNPTGTLLMFNVEFKEPYYHIFTHRTDSEGNPLEEPYDFDPSVGGDNIFDGGYHYIKNICCPLFYENHGVIKNLGLSNVKIGTQTEKYGPWLSIAHYDGATDNAPVVKRNGYDYNYTGALATRNYSTVQNIRVKDLEMVVGIHELTEQEAHNVGALVGVNNGYIEQVRLSGRMNITVQNSNGKEPSVAVGGLVGQNYSSIVDVAQLVDNNPDLPEDHRPTPVQIGIANTMTYGNGAYYIGGLVGNNSGKLSEISLPTNGTDGTAITVDSSRSSGSHSFVGGIVGIAEESANIEISSCLIGSGIVRAGMTTQYSTLDSESYTGGVGGEVDLGVTITNCTAFCSVEGLANAGSNVDRATGGVFGNLVSSSRTGTMSAIAVFGDKSPSGYHVGNFAGKAPKNGDDAASEAYYRNMADVKEFSGIPFVAVYE